MKKHVLLIALLVVLGTGVEAQTVKSPQGQPRQQQPAATVKGGLGPAYMEHHTVTRTHWHVRGGGTRYKVVDPAAPTPNQPTNPNVRPASAPAVPATTAPDAGKR